MLTITYKRDVDIYEKQAAFIDDPNDTVIVIASPKIGKTVGTFTWIYEVGIGALPVNGIYAKRGDELLWIAPIHDTAKMIYKRALRFIPSYLIEHKNEGAFITLITGVTINFKSADKPDSIYGWEYLAVAGDEITRWKFESYKAAKSTLISTGGQFKAIGNYKGEGNFVSKLIKEKIEAQDANFSYYKITATDGVEAGVLKQDVVDQARSDLPEDDYLELYELVPKGSNEGIFLNCFDETMHVHKGLKINKALKTVIGLDFNINPMTCQISQVGHNFHHIIKEFRIPNSDIHDLCEKLKMYIATNEINRSNIIVLGDPAGWSNNAITKGKTSFYTIVARELMLNARKQVIAPRFHYDHATYRLLTNIVLKSDKIDFKVDADCFHSIRDFKYVGATEDNKIKKTGKNDLAGCNNSELTHLMDITLYTHQVYFTKMFKQYLAYGKKSKNKDDVNFKKYDKADVVDKVVNKVSNYKTNI